MRTKIVNLKTLAAALVLGALVAAVGLIPLVTGSGGGIEKTEAPEPDEDQAPGDHGGGDGEGEGEKDKEEGGHGDASKFIEPKWKPGKPLNGSFDTSTLSYTRRVQAWRYHLDRMEIDVPLGRRWQRRIFFECSLEFGREAGMNECDADIEGVVAEIQDVLGSAKLKMLVDAAGMRRLKEQMIEALNRHFKTARVRQIYFTYFLHQRFRAPKAS